MSFIYTNSDVAEKFGCSTRTVDRWAAKLGLTTRTTGGVRLFTAKEVESIAKHLGNGPGNPNLKRKV